MISYLFHVFLSYISYTYPYTKTAKQSDYSGQTWVSGDFTQECSKLSAESEENYTLQESLYPSQHNWVIFIPPTYTLNNQVPLFRLLTFGSFVVTAAPGNPFKGCSPMAVAPPETLKGLWAMQAKSAKGVCNGPTPETHHQTPRNIQQDPLNGPLNLSI